MILKGGLIGENMWYELESVCYQHDWWFFYISCIGPLQIIWASHWWVKPTDLLLPCCCCHSLAFMTAERQSKKNGEKRSCFDYIAMFYSPFFSIKLLLLIHMPDMWKWSPQTIFWATISASNNSISPLQWCLLSWSLSSHDVSPPQSCFIQNCDLLLPLLFVVWSGLRMSGYFLICMDWFAWNVIVVASFVVPMSIVGMVSLDEKRSVSFSEIFHFKIVTSFFLSCLFELDWEEVVIFWFVLI